MIHTSITVGFTTGQYLAFQCYTDNTQEWIENAAHEAANRSYQNIKTTYANFKLDRDEIITAIGSTAIIQAAIAENVVVNHEAQAGGKNGIAATTF
jgi:hypothetical protein